MKKLKFVFTALIIAALFTIVKVTKAQSPITVWWPTDNITLSAHQPFKALLEDRNIEEYDMFWQVDGGHLNPMETSFTDYPHKETYIDLTNWTWKGSGPYEIKFTAKEKGGNSLGEKTVKIFTSSGATQSVTPIPTTLPVNPTPAPTNSPIPSPVAPIATPHTITNNTPTYLRDNSGLFADMESINLSVNNLVKQKVVSQPQAKWFGNWNSDIYKDVESYTSKAMSAGKTAVLVAYNIPNRDCGGYSSGGSGSASDYSNWIKNFAEGIRGNPIVIMEPDALSLLDCHNNNEKTMRTNLIAEAVNTLKNKGAKVYLDAGHAKWHTPTEIASRLNKAGIGKADGFSLNVSNFITTDENIFYGNEISKLTNGKHFVIDTSRNGNGTASDSSWCNPAGRALGEKPYLTSGNIVDAFLWIKRPGESDGNCNGGPSAGIFWEDYARGLAERAVW
jgi:endoglucanase